MVDGIKENNSKHAVSVAKVLAQTFAANRQRHENTVGIFTMKKVY